MKMVPLSPKIRQVDSRRVPTGLRFFGAELAFCVDVALQFAWKGGPVLYSFCLNTCNRPASAE